MQGTSIKLTKDELRNLENCMRERGEWFQMTDDWMRFPYEGHEVYIFYDKNKDNKLPLAVRGVGDVLEILMVCGELEEIAKGGLYHGN